MNLESKGAGIKETMGSEQVFPTSRDEYELLYDIGHGATAIVYVARVKRLNTVVAVKMIDLEQISSGSGQLDDFRHEIQVMKQVKHANLVTYHTSFVVENYLWIVMRLLNVGSILEIMKILENENKQTHIVASPSVNNNIQGNVPGNTPSSNESGSIDTRIDGVAGTGTSTGAGSSNISNATTSDGESLISSASSTTLSSNNNVNINNGLKVGLVDEGSIATILKGVLMALEYFHSQNLVHRDIKAGNILLDTDGTVQVADFGVSASLLIEGFRKNRTTFVGTPCWMAPEVMEYGSARPEEHIHLEHINNHSNLHINMSNQSDYDLGSTDNQQGLISNGGTGSNINNNNNNNINNANPGSTGTSNSSVVYHGYGSKADIWSFGILCMELATGYAPYAKYPAMKVIMLTLSNPSPTLDLSVYDYSKSYKKMIDWCLQKDPLKRPTAAELLKCDFIKGRAKDAEHLKNHLISKVKPLTIRAHLAMLDHKKKLKEQDDYVKLSQQVQTSVVGNGRTESVTTESDPDMRDKLYLFRNPNQPVNGLSDNICLYDLNTTVYFKLRLKDHMGQLKDIIFPFNPEDDTPERISEELLDNNLINAADAQITSEAIHAFLSCVPAPHLIQEEDNLESIQDSIRFPIQQFSNNTNASSLTKSHPSDSDLNNLIGFAQLSLAPTPDDA